MNGTKIKVLLEDTRIREYLCRWAPLTEATHVEGLYRTILVALLADALCDKEFREEHPLANRHGNAHFLFVERVTGNITFRLLKTYGQCQVCSQSEFDLLPCNEAREISLALCRSCGAWVANDGIYQWVKIGSVAGG